MNLHKLTEQYIQIQDEDLPDDVLADTLEAMEGEIEIKGENLAKVIEKINYDIDTLKAHKANIDKRIKARVNKIESIKNYLRENMEATGIKKLQSPLFTINCVEGRNMVNIVNEDELDDDYVTVKVVTSPDKKKILEDLKQGVDVKGATLAKTKSSIRIS